jgi:hypothetical protein
MGHLAGNWESKSSDRRKINKSKQERFMNNTKELQSKPEKKIDAFELASESRSTIDAFLKSLSPERRFEFENNCDRIRQKAHDQNGFEVTFYTAVEIEIIIMGFITGTVLLIDSEIAAKAFKKRRLASENPQSSCRIAFQEEVEEVSELMSSLSADERMHFEEAVTQARHMANEAKETMTIPYEVHGFPLLILAT